MWKRSNDKALGTKRIYHRSRSVNVSKPQVLGRDHVTVENQRRNQERKKYVLKTRKKGKLLRQRKKKPQSRSNMIGKPCIKGHKNMGYDVQSNQRNEILKEVLRLQLNSLEKRGSLAVPIQTVEGRTTNRRSNIQQRRSETGKKTLSLVANKAAVTSPNNRVQRSYTNVGTYKTTRNCKNINRHYSEKLTTSSIKTVAKPSNTKPTSQGLNKSSISLPCTPNKQNKAILALKANTSLPVPASNLNFLNNTLTTHTVLCPHCPIIQTESPVLWRERKLHESLSPTPSGGENWFFGTKHTMISPSSKSCVISNPYGHKSKSTIVEIGDKSGNNGAKTKKNSETKSYQIAKRPTPPALSSPVTVIPPSTNESLKSKDEYKICASRTLTLIVVLFIIIVITVIVYISTHYV